MVVNLQSGHEKALHMIKGNNSKIIKSRVMVLVHDTSSYCALYLDFLASARGVLYLFE